MTSRKTKMIAAMAVFCAAAPSSPLWANDEEQVNEAIVVFDGKAAANMRGGTWKVVYSSAEGPEMRAIEVLTDRIGAYVLREGHLSTGGVRGSDPIGGVRVVE